MELLLHWLLLAVAVYVIAAIMPTIHIDKPLTALIVAIVYSIISFILGWFLVLISLPFMLITFGLFKLVINAFLLWITDKLVPGFKIDGFGSTLIAAILITVIDNLLRMAF
jgi:putative membrane protein